MCSMLLNPITLENVCALRTVILVSWGIALSTACGTDLDSINLNLTSGNLAGYHKGT